MNLWNNIEAPIVASFKLSTVHQNKQCLARFATDLYIGSRTSQIHLTQRNGQGHQLEAPNRGPIDLLISAVHLPSSGGLGIVAHVSFRVLDTLSLEPVFSHLNCVTNPHDMISLKPGHILPCESDRLGRECQEKAHERSHLT